MRPELRYDLGFCLSFPDQESRGPGTVCKVRFNLKMPAPDLWKRLWWNGAIMPKKYRERVGDAGFADKPIGSGTFQVGGL